MHSSVPGVQLTISIVHPSLTLYEFKGYSHIQVSWITVDLWWSWWTMATTDNKQQSAIVHYCKICHRGFSCGGALGGHMRAHNISEVINSIQDEQQQQQGLLVGDKPEGSKHSYFLRTTSNRFLNLQSLVRGEHSSERASLEDDKLLSPISSSVSKIEDGGAKKAYLWKFLGENGNENGCFSREEQDLANVLITLSNNTVDINMYKNKTKEVSTPLAKGLFQCKACKKVFNSHQALGGHRASHKKVKGCYAAKPDDLTDDEMLEEDFISHNEISMAQESPDPNFNLNNLTSQNTSHDDHDITREGKVHECSICYRVFSSGQALGGHKRFHWLQTDSTFLTPFHDQFQYYGAEDYKKLTTSCSKDSELLDLNLPPDQTVDEKSTTTFLQPSINNVIKINNDEENKGYENCKKIQVCGKRSKKKLQDSGHNYNGEESSRLCKLAKHCNVRDLKLDAVSSPWLQVGLASNK